MIRARENERGVILIALLWILTILSVIALSLARETFVEVAAARNSRDLADAYYIARAGVTATVYQAYQKLLTRGAQINASTQPPDPIDLGKLTGQFGDGEYDVEIQDESGKINLATVQEPQLKNLVSVIGIPEPDASVIVDSILDWKEPGNLARPNGAKNDYYQTLQPPYAVWNDMGRMKAVEELLLVRGVTSDYFYGHREKTQDGQIIDRYGLSHYLTVYGAPGRVNINYAPLAVLLSIPGMPPETARMICERRQTKPFTTMDEISREVAPNPGPQVTGQLYIGQSLTYSITASGHRAGSKARRIIRAIIRLTPGQSEVYRVLYWNENVPY